MAENGEMSEKYWEDCKRKIKKMKTKINKLKKKIAEKILIDKKT